MYRLLEDSGEPTKKQTPGKSIRPIQIGAALKKGKTGRGSLRQARGKTPAMICWEASDQHGNAKRRSVSEWRFVRRSPSALVLFPYYFFGLPRFAPATCTLVRLAVVSSLPIKAADANHPDGEV
jgi:hypothetical protein